MLIRVLEAIGRYVLRKLNYTGEIVMLLIATLGQLNHRPRWKHVVRQMSHLGVDSLTIVGLTMLFTGMVLTLQIGHELVRFGAQNTIGGIVAIGIGRELGPVLVGVVCAGRVGAAITAEISTMKVTEQIDALRVMATSPVGYLIVPRMIACACMVPLLSVFGDIIGVLGGWVIATKYVGISSFLYMNSINVYVEAYDMTGGIVKSVVFGVVIAVLGCYYGLRCPDGAEGVGKATTRTVVASIIMIFMLNVFLSMLLYR